MQTSGLVVNQTTSIRDDTTQNQICPCPAFVQRGLVQRLVDNTTQNESSDPSPALNETTNVQPPLGRSYRSACAKEDGCYPTCDGYQSKQGDPLPNTITNTTGIAETMILPSVSNVPTGNDTICSPCNKTYDTSIQEEKKGDGLLTESNYEVECNCIDMGQDSPDINMQQNELAALEKSEKDELLTQLAQWQSLRRQVLTKTTLNKTV